MKASVIFSKDFVVGTAGERMFGSFLEHGARAIYGGIYEPEHPAADKEGLRGDVLDLVKELQVSAVRYPGGNFVSAYDWRDGIGPRETRPVRTELAWETLEPNWFGLDEFMGFCEKTKIEPVITVNLATRGVQEARDIAEYCNFPGGTALSDLRAQNGHSAPYGVKLWCLGNEMDGEWQIGQKTAADYGEIAKQAAKAIKVLDPKAECIACYTTSLGMEKHTDWGTQALLRCYDYVDYISLHKYCTNDELSTPDFMAATIDIERYIEAAIASCDYVKSILHSDKTMYLSFDEWNVWYHCTGKEPDRDRWTIAPHLLEDNYTMEDAVVVGLNLIMLLRYSHRIKIGCLAQLVNIIAPILTQDGGDAIRQTIFYPFLHASLYGRGSVLRDVTTTPTYISQKYGVTPYLSNTAVFHEERGEVTVFAVNRSDAESIDYTCELRDFGELTLLEHIVFTDSDRYARNTFEEPERCQPKTVSATTFCGGVLHAELPPISWNVMRLRR